MRIRIPVTLSHIRRARYGFSRCPLALAIKPHLKRGLHSRPSHLMNAKTQARIAIIMAAAGYPDPLCDAGKHLYATVRLTILETDRDTRYACAKAVVMLAGEQGELMANAAHQACLNTQAV